MGEELKEEFILLLFLGGRWEDRGVKYRASHGVKWERNRLCWPLHIQGLETFLTFDNQIHYYDDDDLKNNVPIFGPIKYFKQSKYSKHHRHVTLSTHQCHLINVYTVFP